MNIRKSKFKKLKLLFLGIVFLFVGCGKNDRNIESHSESYIVNDQKATDYYKQFISNEKIEYILRSESDQENTLILYDDNSFSHEYNEHKIDGTWYIHKSNLILKDFAVGSGSTIKINDLKKNCIRFKFNNEIYDNSEYCDGLSRELADQ